MEEGSQMGLNDVTGNKSQQKFHFLAQALHLKLRIQQ